MYFLVLFLELRVEIDIWTRTMNSISAAGREAAMVKLLLQQKINTMNSLLEAKHAQDQ